MMPPRCHQWEGEEGSHRPAAAPAAWGWGWRARSTGTVGVVLPRVRCCCYPGAAPTPGAGRGSGPGAAYGLDCRSGGGMDGLDRSVDRDQSRALNQQIVAVGSGGASFARSGGAETPSPGRFVWAAHSLGSEGSIIYNRNQNAAEYIDPRRGSISWGIDRVGTGSLTPAAGT